MNITDSLTEELAIFVETKVSIGGYGSLSEVIREALRRMESAEAQEAEYLLFLRQSWQAGIDCGNSADMAFEAVVT